MPTTDELINILTINDGSSSLKMALYHEQTGENINCLWSATAKKSEQDGKYQLQATQLDGTVVLDTTQSLDSPAQAIPILLDAIPLASAALELAVVGHRIVHGGGLFENSVLMTPTVLQQLEQTIELAPNHNGPALEGIRIVSKQLGNQIKQVAVFDTAFHRTIPPAAFTYGGPYKWLSQGIRRYGFHGISHRYVSQKASTLMNNPSGQGLRLITCHLGSGCSLAAIHNGQSIDTTMGYTPMEGLMMATRSGSIDPGILIHLLQHQKMDATELNTVLNQQSGLLGLSELTSDLPILIDAMTQGNTQAKLAYDVYIHRLRAGMGEMLASLGGLDALVFTGGVGENSATIRAAACDAFKFLGLTVDEDLNTTVLTDADIASEESAVRVFVIKTQENAEIARECLKIYRDTSEN